MKSWKNSSWRRSGRKKNAGILPQKQISGGKPRRRHPCLRAASTEFFRPQSFPPVVHRRQYNDQLSLPLGTISEQTQGVLEELQTYVKQTIKGYRRLVLSVGGGSSGYSGSLQILLPDPKDQIDTPVSIRTKLAPQLNAIPGATTSFSSGRQFSSNSAVDVENPLQGSGCFAGRSHRD
jgi:multidrug efflux pump subunit AcrB